MKRYFWSQRGLSSGMCALACLLAQFLALPASADVGFANEYMKRLKMYQTVQPIGEAPFGENVNLYTGELGFNQTDVELEGNGPALVLAREYQSRRQYADPINTLDDWKLSIPRMETMSKDSWQVSTFPNGPGAPVASYARCTQFGKPFDPHNEQHLWWHGYELITERNERQQLLFRNAATATPTGIDAGNGVLTYFPAMTQQKWVIGCLPQTSNGAPGEGFLAVSPDGTRYYFTHLVSAPATTVAEYDPDLKRPIKHFRSLQVMYATRIEDRFGNYLTYAYDGTRLTSITASDGRQVSLLWNNGTGASDQKVTQIIVQPGASAPQNWYYTYQNGRLRYVTRPDNSQWSFALQEATELALPTNTCATRAPGDATGPQTVSTVGHPSGLVGSFVMAGKFHARSYVVSYCDPIPPSLEVQENNFPIFSTSSLISKTLSGPGIANSTWTYSYSAPVGSTTHDACAQNGTCQDWRTVEVQNPGGDRIRYTLSTRWGPLESKLLKTEHFEGAATTPLRTDTVDYAAANNGPYPASLGGTGQVWQTNSEKSTTWTPERTRTITQQGVAFTSQVNSFDAFANPLNMTRSSSLGYSRTDVAAYHHNTALWVLGQLASSTNSNTGLVESQNDYWPATALPQRTYAFGKLQQYLVYNADGTLASATDGNNRTTSFGNWKRGIPQTIIFADNTLKSAQVNNLGQIDWVKNEVGAKTCYGYDAMGRLSSLTHPSEVQAGACNQDNWLATTITFAPVAASYYGLPVGHWRRTEATGNARKVTFYDALWRPVVQEAYDAGNTSNTLTQTVTRYDSDGRVVYASYPQRSQDPAVYTTWGNPAASPNALGTVTAYDALGRPTQVTWNSEHGLLGASYAYLNNFQTRYTDERGQQTGTSYMAYDQPGSDWISGINHPEGAITEIFRDTFGKPVNISRHNASLTEWSGRYYTYDPYQRLCKQSELETGTTAFGYDEAGNQIWSAVGLSWSPNAPCEYTSTHASVVPKRVDRTYDARHRLKTLSFPDGRGNQVWTYTADGLPDTITAYNNPNQGAPVVTAYHYNQRRMLNGQGETASQPTWYSWGIGYGYDTYGNLASHSYPSGLAVTYSPNALGQATQVGSPGQTYASGIQYHPNGGIKQFTYGNGLVHTMVQNARQLPHTSTDSGGVLSHQYSYDYSGNVTQIQDLNRGGNYSRWMTYDGLSRLKSASSCSFGPGCGFYYDYDTLDNLTRVQSPGGVDRYYCYDARQQLTNLKSGPCASGASVVGLGYDARGNLANKNGQAYVFDFGNRLREVAGKEGYRYDGLGRRVVAWHPDTSVTVSQYNQAGQLFYDQNSSTGYLTDHVYLAGSLVAQRRVVWATNVPSIRYQHTDALGTPVAVTDSAGAVVERSEYDPYGRLNNRPLTDGLGYTGHFQDAATGMTYMQQRYYDPQIGRFLSMDPVTANANTGVNFNRYWYANNNPYRFIDPDGRYSCSGAMVCRAVRDGLAAMNKSLKNLENSDPQKAAIVRAAITEIGTKNDGRGPSYIAGEIKGEGLAHTDQRGTTKLDMVQIKGAGKNDIAKAMAHEATHDIDVKNSGQKTTEPQIRETETNAYRATQAVAKGLGENISEQQVADAVEKSVDRAMQRMHPQPNE